MDVWLMLYVTSALHIQTGLTDMLGFPSSAKQLWLLIFLIMFSKNPENYVFTLDTLFSSHSCLQPSEK